MSDVTRILNAIERGEAKPTDELLPLVYEELRLLAAQKLSHERPGQTLQATALVHEAYIRLVGEEPQSWENRGHFFAAAAEAMRRILIDHARHRQARKCGGGRERMPLDDAEVTDPATPEDIVALDDALAKLAAEDPQAAEIVKLRLFAGLSIDQAAEANGVSRATAYRQWLSHAPGCGRKLQASSMGVSPMSNTAVPAVLVCSYEHSTNEIPAKIAETIRV